MDMIIKYFDVDFLYLITYFSDMIYLYFREICNFIRTYIVIRFYPNFYRNR